MTARFQGNIKSGIEDVFGRKLGYCVTFGMGLTIAMVVAGCQDVIVVFNDDGTDSRIFPGIIDGLRA